VIVALPLILMPAAGAAILAAPRLWRIAWIRIADPEAPVGAESRALASAPCLVVPIQAVVDMFGIADLSDFDDASPFGQFVLRNTFGNSTEVRRSASPITYVAPGAPPFLILQGSEDPMVRPRQSVLLAQRLHGAGVRATLLEVQGTEHTLDTPGQRPSPDELTAAASDFFTAALR
jgi:acetyl esterase/lipase